MDYKETKVVGRRWVRCGAVRVANPVPGQGEPQITFIEQDAIALDDGNVAASPRPGGDVTVGFDPAAKFDLYNPKTGAKTGKRATHAEVYALLYSLYRASAESRDAAQKRDSNGDGGGA